MWVKSLEIEFKSPLMGPVPLRVLPVRRRFTNVSEWRGDSNVSDKTGSAADFNKVEVGWSNKPIDFFAVPGPHSFTAVLSEVLIRVRWRRE